MQADETKQLPHLPAFGVARAGWAIEFYEASDMNSLPPLVRPRDLEGLRVYDAEGHEYEVTSVEITSPRSSLLANLMIRVRMGVSVRLHLRSVGRISVSQMREIAERLYGEFPRDPLDHLDVVRMAID